jgi:hypothetical protein
MHSGISWEQQLLLRSLKCTFANNTISSQYIYLVWIKKHYTTIIKYTCKHCLDGYMFVKRVCVAGSKYSAMKVDRIYNASYQQLPARAGGTDYHSKLPSQYISRFPAPLL